MKKFPGILFLVALVFAATCGPSPRGRIAARLDDVESYINEYPDSALAVLEGLDSMALTTRALRARYSLLHVMALYKSYEDVTVAGLLDDAILYYDRHGSADERLKTQYYKGCILQEMKDLKGAAVAYSQAEQYAEQAHDTHTVALLYESFSSVYNAVYNTQKQQEYVEKALVVLNQSRDPMFGSVLGELAMVFHTRKDWTKADSLYREAIAHSDAYPHALARYLSNYARMKMIMPEKDPIEAINLLNRKREITGKGLTTKEAGAYAYALDLLEDKEEADAIIEQLKVLPDLSRRDALSWLYRIYYSRGDLLQAVSFLKEMRDVEYEVVEESLTESVTQALQDHYAHVAQQENERKLRQVLLALGVRVFLLILSVVLLFQRRRIRADRDRLLSIRSSLEHDLREQENRAEASSSDMSARLEHLRMQLQQERMDRLRKSGRYSYWLWMVQNDRSSSRDVVKMLRKDLREVCAPEKDHHALERRLDRELDGLVSRLKEDLHLNGKTSEERFLCYWLIGLKPDMIAELMGGIKINNVYVKTHRLEERIRQLNKPEYRSLI